MNDRRSRRLAAAAALFVSAVALLATTPGAPTARADASGELYVAPDEPATVEVRFRVADPAPDEIQRVSVERMIGGSTDRRLGLSVSAAIEGAGPPQSGGYAMDLDPADCATGCQVVATIDARWLGQPEPGMRVAWQLELAIEYASHVPEDAVAVAVVRGGDEAPPRLAWLALGALVSIVAGAALWLRMPRFPVLRLVLAGGLLIVAAWPLIQTAPFLARWFESRLDWEVVGLLVAGVVLGTGVALGIGRAVVGRATLLRTVGWMVALVIGYAWWALATNLGTYRPHEMVALTAGLGVSIAGAITSVPLGSPDEPRPRTMGLATSLVMAIQGLILVPVLLASGGAILSLALELTRGRMPALAMLGLTLVAVAVPAFFVAGLRDWRHGSPRTLMIGNAVATLVVSVVGVGVLAQGEGGLLSIGLELRVLVICVMLIFAAGTIGLGLVDPPVAHEQRDDEAGQRHEIPRVADEDDGARPAGGT